jgi:hypothetical protein
MWRPIAEARHDIGKFLHWAARLKEKRGAEAIKLAAGSLE